MNISITGTLGAGKSSVCKILQESGYDYISNGQIFREIAEERKVSVIELNKIAETDASIDKMLDERSIQLGKEKDHVVFDSRMAWHFVPHSFKVFLAANTNETGRRVYEDNRAAEEYQSKEEAKNGLVNRQSLEKKRFLDLYGVDYLNLSHYDLVIDTTHVSPEEVARKILEQEIVFEQDAAQFPRAFLNPSNLYPTQGKQEFSEEVLNQYLEGKLDRNEDAVKAGILENCFAILEGHHRVLASAKCKDSFVFVHLSSIADISFPEKLVFHDFEEIGGFQYAGYPDCNEPLLIEYL
ncbi:MAG: AAA family ATPase [Lachnospiraceae bacterium]|jgi:cytidylate kinase|nr:AAA family ATPase [Lachnospiraceae bacterium]